MPATTDSSIDNNQATWMTPCLLHQFYPVVCLWTQLPTQAVCFRNCSNIGSARP